MRGKTFQKADLGRTLNLLLLILLLVLLNLWSAQRPKRWDWSQGGVHRLSARTLALLSEMREDADLYVFVSELEESYGDLRQVLESYRLHAPRLRLHFVDPDRHASEYRLFQQRVGWSEENAESSVSELALLLSLRGRRRALRRSEVFAAALGGEPAFSPRPLEEGISSVLAELMRGKTKQLCFSQGHGELRIDDAGDRSLRPLLQQLSFDGLQAQGIELGDKDDLSACDVLWVAGVQRPWSEDEVRTLESFWRKGGRLLLALDPRIEGEAMVESGLEAFLRSLGVQLGRDLVIEEDAGRRLSSRPFEAFFVDRFGDHPLAHSFASAKRPLLLQLAQSLALDPSSDARVLFRSSSRSRRALSPRALFSGGGRELQAAPDLPLALALRKEGRPESRLVLIGDSDWLTLPSEKASNLDFARACVFWLLGRNPALERSPNVDRALVMSQSDLRALFWRVVVMIPSSFGLLAFAAWWSRRR